VSEAGVLVVKVGGAVAATAACHVSDLARRHDVVVVHGAGPQITEEMERRGLSVEFVAGRRVTSAAALEVVRASLTAVNGSLCAAIGPRALPLPGGVLEAVRIPELGLVGNPVPSAPSAVLDALGSGRIPVVAPLAQGPLNVNGDEAAAALAVGLGAERLVFLTDVPGVLVRGEVAQAIAADEAERLVGAGALGGGIVPKLLAAARAARLGVAAAIGETAVTA
jgi:acetylglutamate kinase